MEFTKVQLNTLICNFLKHRENGLNELLQMVLNAIMKLEQSEYLGLRNGINKANGYRPGRVYGHGKLLELRIPRDRNGQFYPKILTLLRSQQHELDTLVSSLYARGLTQSQVGQVFEDLYGRHYSTSAISRMIESMREQVREWVNRPLPSYYPILYVDAIHVNVRRDTVRKEAFYVVLGVTADARRDVVSIVNVPTESAVGWEQVFSELYDRGVHQIGLLVSDALKGLDTASARVWPGRAHQRCVTHVKRGLLARVRPEDRPKLAAHLSQVFTTGVPGQTSHDGWQRLKTVCEHWAKQYPSVGKVASQTEYQYAFTYLNYHPKIQSMIYTTNWIERLNKDFRRVLRMRDSMPGQESVITLMGKVAMDKKAYERIIPHMRLDADLFDPKRINPVDKEPQNQ